jgi:hypothetical protein
MNPKEPPNKCRPKQHSRRRLKSSSYEPSSINELTAGDSDLLKPVNLEYEKQLLLLIGDFPRLTTKQIIVRLCIMRGPWRAVDLQQRMHELGRDIGINTIYKTLHDLVCFGILVRVNGGYAISTWKEME